MCNVNRVSSEIDRASLPRRDQLSIHVDDEEFFQLMEQLPEQG
jgi:hypothetical protein